MSSKEKVLKNNRVIFIESVAASHKKRSIDNVVSRNEQVRKQKYGYYPSTKRDNSMNPDLHISRLIGLFKSKLDILDEMDLRLLSEIYSKRPEMYEFVLKKVLKHKIALTWFRTFICLVGLVFLLLLLFITAVELSPTQHFVLAITISVGTIIISTIKTYNQKNPPSNLIEFDDGSEKNKEIV